MLVLCVTLPLSVLRQPARLCFCPGIPSPLGHATGCAWVLASSTFPAYVKTEIHLRSSCWHLHKPGPWPQSCPLFHCFYSCENWDTSSLSSKVPSMVTHSRSPGSHQAATLQATANLCCSLSLNQFASYKAPISTAQAKPASCKKGLTVGHALLSMLAFHPPRPDHTAPCLCYIQVLPSPDSPPSNHPPHPPQGYLTTQRNELQLGIIHVNQPTFSEARPQLHVIRANQPTAFIPLQSWPPRGLPYLCARPSPPSSPG